MTELAAGHVIAGRYRLEHLLGAGGMGAVWSARHLELRSRVAVKLIVPRHATDPDMLSRFVREARAAAALRSPHVVQIFDSGIDDGLAFIVMEQLEGESLAERLKREGRLSSTQTATIVTHVARAISRAHEAHLVHRDLKPENIFLVQNEDELVAKVLDFGIAKVSTGEDDEPPSTRTETGRLVGSPYYMSPEQARGRTVDFRSDLWALGVLAYECLLGQRPFRGEALGEIILSICAEPPPVPSAHGSVPDGFDAWFARATARPPEERFQSARELAAALRSSLSQDSGAISDPSARSTSSGVASPRPRSSAAISVGTTTAEPTSSEAGRARTPRRRPWSAFVALATTSTVLGLVFAFGHRGAHDREPATVSVAAPPPVVPAIVEVAAPASSLLAPAPPAPAVSVTAASAASAPARRVQSTKPSRAVPPPSAPAPVVKDPLSTRF